MHHATQAPAEFMPRRFQSGYRDLLESHLNQRTFLCTKIRAIFPEILFADLWEASALITTGQYRYLLGLCYERSKELRGKIVTIMNV